MFSPPTNGAYKTLTVGSYSGNGATMTMNAALGGPGSLADHLTLASSPTGATSLVIRNVGGQGAQTSSSGIPLISTTSGVIPANVFTLQNLVVVGGYQYNLTGAGTDQESLVSTPTTTTAQATSSVASVAQSKESQTVTARQLNSILLGANEQINCTSCSSGFASVGSFAIGAHGRWTINRDVSLLAGFSFDEYSAPGVQVNSAYNIAGGLRYDYTEMGSSRPFVEAGAALSPYQGVTYTRTYPYGSTTATGTGSSTDRALAIYGRAGWVDRLTPIDEAAIYADLSRSWQTSTGYSEQASPSNPYAATFNSGVDTLNIARIAVQYTHLFFDRWEVNGTAGLAHGFSASYTGQADLDGFGIISAAAPSAFSWAELGGRIGYRFNDRLVLDGFVIGTLGPQPVGDTIHGGLGVRYSF